MSLNGKACIVTGGGRGIGRTIVLRLTSGGANVLALSRTKKDLDETAAKAAGNSGKCVGLVADVSRPDHLRNAIDACDQLFGRLDVLVNNAGVAPVERVESMSEEVFDRLVDTNIKAVFHACRLAWPKLKASKGTIVNVSSVAAIDPFPGLGAYGASKAWVNAFTTALAAEGKPDGIRAVAVGPGAVETDMLRAAFPDYPKDDTLAPEDIAAAVEWLLDDRAQNVTGQVVYVKN